MVQDTDGDDLAATQHTAPGHDTRILHDVRPAQAARRRCRADRMSQTHEGARAGRQAIQGIHPGECHLDCYTVYKYNSLTLHTQNIDALEAKAGLTYGLGEWKQAGPSSKPATGSGSPKKKAASKPATAKSVSKLAKGKGRAVPEEVHHHEPATPANIHAVPEAQQISNEQQADQQFASTSKAGLDGLAEQLSSTSLAASEGTVVLPDSQEEQSTGQTHAISSIDNLNLDEGVLLMLPSSPSDTSLVASSSIASVIPETPELDHETSTVLANVVDIKPRPARRQSNLEVVVPLPKQRKEAEQENNDSMADVSMATNSDAFDVEALIQPSVGLAAAEDQLLPSSSQPGLAYSEATQAVDTDYPSSSQASVPEPNLSQTSTSSIAQSPTPAALPSASSSAVPATAATGKRALTIPNVIPLHGTLDEMHCPKCGHVEPTSAHLHTLASGHSLHCPSCLSYNAARACTGERSRGVGVMKVSVVLYGEEHTSAARVGEITSRDLMKSARPDYLIVAGTTLKIPGVKKLVRELSRLVKQLNQYEVPKVDEEGNVIPGKWETKTNWRPRVVFVNRDPPLPEKTWGDIFDYHVQGDVQDFARTVREAMRTKTGGAGAALPAIKKSLPAPKVMQQATLANYYGAQKQSVPYKMGPKYRGIKVVGAFASSSSSLPTATSIIQQAIREAKKETPKPKPGWKGYALDPEFKAKHASYWVERLPEGSKRRRSSIAPPQPTPVARRSAGPSNSSFRKPKAMAGLPSRSELQAIRSQIDVSLSRRLELTYSGSLSKEYRYDAIQPSGASTPPSLASDVSTASDDVDDAASTKEEDEVGRAVTISSSDGSSEEYPSTDIVPDSQPHDTKMTDLSSNATIVVSNSQPSQGFTFSASPSLMKFPYHAPTGATAATEPIAFSSPNKRKLYIDADETESDLSDVEEDKPVPAKRRRVTEMFKSVKANKARVSSRPKRVSLT